MMNPSFNQKINRKYRTGEIWAELQKHSLNFKKVRHRVQKSIRHHHQSPNITIICEIL